MPLERRPCSVSAGIEVFRWIPVLADEPSFHLRLAVLIFQTSHPDTFLSLGFQIAGEL